MRITIIIPTLNRPRELARLLSSLAQQTHLPDEIIVVCQGNMREETFRADHPHLAFIWIQETVPSLTKARNRGVRAATGDIIGFLDDDCAVEKDYVEWVLKFFVAHPSAKGVQGVITNFVEGHVKKVGGGFLYGMYNAVAKIFLLNNSSTKNKLLLSGRNQYAARVDTVTVCEWLSGIGNYRRDVFLQFHFDELLSGYALGEDKLFSYAIYLRYPNSLFIDPSIRLVHDHAKEGRPAEEALVAMKVHNTWYVWDKLLRPRGRTAILAFWWGNVGDIFIAICAVIAGKRPFLFGWWHIHEYWRLLWSKV